MARLKTTAVCGALAFVCLVAVTALAMAEQARVKGYAFDGGCIRERMDRGLVAMPLGRTKVYVGWRLLAEDPKGVTFNVYRRTGEGKSVRLTEKPISRTTDFVDAAAPAGKELEYTVRAAAGGKEAKPSGPVRVTLGEDHADHISIKLRAATRSRRQASPISTATGGTTS